MQLWKSNLAGDERKQVEAQLVVRSGQHSEVYLQQHNHHSVITNTGIYRTMESIKLSYTPVEGEREMFYLTTHSTHFIYGYMERERERNVLFNDALNTFYLRLYGEREREMFYLTTHSTHFIYGYMASDIWLRTILIVREETRCRHIGYSYRLTAMHHPTDRITHTTAFVTPVVEHWLEREIAQWARVGDHRCVSKWYTTYVGDRFSEVMTQ